MATRKHESKNQDKHRWRNVIAWVLPFLIVPIGFTLFTATTVAVWLSVLVWCAFFVYTVAMLERYIWHDSNRAARILCITLCVTALGAGAVWQRIIHPKSPFSLAVELILGGAQTDARHAHFWCVIGDDRFPAHAGMFMRIAKSGEPMLISSYVVEAQDGNSGQWIELVRVPALIDDFYFGNDLTKMRKWEAPKLDMLIEGHTIGPSNPARGWAFFELREGLKVERGAEIHVRITDAAGEEFTQTAVIEGENIKGKNDVQKVPLTWSAETRDISRLNLRYWSIDQRRTN